MKTGMHKFSIVSNVIYGKAEKKPGHIKINNLGEVYGVVTSWADRSVYGSDVIEVYRWAIEA